MNTPRQAIQLSDLSLYAQEGRLRAHEPECALCDNTGDRVETRPANTHPMYAHLPGAAEPIDEVVPCECAPVRRAARRINGARLPHIGVVASLGNFGAHTQFDVTAVPEVAARLGQAVLTARAFVAGLGADGALGLSIAGGPRSGKTHLISGIGLAAALANHSVRYLHWTDLVRFWATPSQFDFDPRSDRRLVLLDDVTLSDEDGESSHQFQSMLNQRLRIEAPTVATFRDMDLNPHGQTTEHSVASHLSSYAWTALTSGGAVVL